jgi:hypothetical protein
MIGADERIGARSLRRIHVGSRRSGGTCSARVSIMATTTLLDRPHRLTMLKALYLYTVIGAGMTGLWALFAPQSFVAAFAIQGADPYLLGMVGAVDAGFAAVALVGLRAPDRFAPVFLLQLVYKSLWLIVVFAPRAVHGAPGPAWLVAAVFASYVVLDLIALPFASLLVRPR